jgi:hypothetical protein
MGPDMLCAGKMHLVTGDATLPMLRDKHRVLVHDLQLATACAVG